MATITKYHKFMKDQQNGTAVVDFDSDTIKVALVTSSYTPSASSHDFFDDITNEVSGTNYTAGGASLANKTLNESAGTSTFDADDVAWTQHASGFSNARYAIIYKSTGDDATSPLIGYIDFTSDKGNVSGDLTIQWGASGILTFA